MSSKAAEEAVGITPDEVRELASTVRDEGFDLLADWLEENADEVQE